MADRTRGPGRDLAEADARADPPARGLRDRESWPAEGQLLFDEGDREIDFFVVLSGAVEIRQYDGRRVPAGRPAGPGEFIGDPATLSGRAAVVQARSRGDSEVLRIAGRAIPPGGRRGLGAERPDPPDLPGPPLRS